MAERTQIPPHPNHPRDKILRGFLCEVHRYANAARSRRRAGVHVATSGFLLPAPPCVTKFRKGFCAECITRRISRSLHNSAGAVLRRRRCAAARTQRKFFRLKFVRYAHRQTAGHRHSRAQLHIRSHRPRRGAGASVGVRSRVVVHILAPPALWGRRFCHIAQNHPV